MALHLLRHAKATLRLLTLRKDAIEAFDASEQTAQHSLLLLFITIPLTVWLGTILVGRHLPRIGYSVANYIPLAALQSLVATLLMFVLAYGVCRIQGLAERFAVFVTTQMWLKLFSVILIVTINRATAGMLFTLHELTVIGTSLYLLQLGYTCVFAKAALRCNWLLACGLAIVMFALAGSTHDALNYYLFGTTRPIQEFDFGLTDPR